MSTPIAPSTLPTTLGSLRASGYESQSVREEIRRNLERRLAEGTPLTSSVLGFEDTVFNLPAQELGLSFSSVLYGHPASDYQRRVDIVLQSRPLGPAPR